MVRRHGCWQTWQPEREAEGSLKTEYSKTRAYGGHFSPKTLHSVTDKHHFWLVGLGSCPRTVQRNIPKDVSTVPLGVHDRNVLLIQCANDLSSLPKTILNGDENTLVFENLNPNSLYEVSITAIYPDESESEDLSGTERTRRCLTFKQDLAGLKLHVKKQTCSCITNVSPNSVFFQCA